MAVREIDSSAIFSPEQLAQHFKIYAGPGAGKTHFIVQNIKNIVKSDSRIKNSKNRKILCITYTNAAVAEISQRLGTFSKYVVVSTIHSFIIDYIIKPYQCQLKELMNSDFNIKVTNNLPITSQIEGLGILHGIEREEIYNWLNNKCGENAEIAYGKKIMGEVEIDIAEFLDKGSMKIKSSKSISDKHVLLLKEYLWNSVRKLSHDEILYFGYRMAIVNSLIAYALRVEFPFILVDEFQDTNPLQTRLISFLGKKGTIVGVIGDRAQSIYSFQGAVPQEFADFNINNSIQNYTISGNRRSTAEIVSLCNYIRQADKNLVQQSCKNTNHKKVTFLCGQYNDVIDIVQDIIHGDGAVLTRSWAAAFKYIIDVDVIQAEILKKIYNTYYPTSIDIRKEISEHNNITWVKALRFVVSMQQALDKKSIPDIFKALSYTIDVKKFNENGGFSPKNILCIRNFIMKYFSHDVLDNLSVCAAFEVLNKAILLPENHKMKEVLILGGTNMSAEEPWIKFKNEYDEKLLPLLDQLLYSTGIKLFVDVFSEESKYMTVHQAKGREFEKVFVSVEPVRGDGVKSFLDTFVNPDVIGPNPQNEFARIVYVACSRAQNELYIHIPGGNREHIKAILDNYSIENNLECFYEIV